ncbi:hypothetical protein PybrP1_000658 [[Pythium] brassicae (nom. inval.)]|nr:hypothetical protein PybrP1_000658 [[Pythium] brassicae (nom. inval.)]
MARWALATALLAAFAALLLSQDGVRRQLVRYLPPVLAAYVVPLASISSADVAASDSSLSVALDREALRAYVNENSRSALRWGTYRSGLYLGVRSRSYPYFVASGLLWGTQHEDVSQLRHECRQEDRLQKYGWLQHDGRRYGLQSVEDQFNRVQLRTHYVRLGADERAGESAGGWATRVEAAHLEPRDERLRKKQVARTKLSLFYYVDLGCEDESLGHACRQALKNLIEVASEPTSAACAMPDGAAAMCTHMALSSDGAEDSSAATGDAPLRFRIDVQLKAKHSVRHSELRFSALRDTNVLNVKERLQQLAERAPGAEDAEIYLDNIVEDDSTLVVVQAIVDADTAAFEAGDVLLDVVLTEAAPGADVAASLASALPLDARVAAEISERSRAFEAKFDETFQLSDKRLDAAGTVFNESHVRFAHAAFSNLLGGTGFFYGSSLVQHDPARPEVVVEAAPKPLFAAVPSRSFFPRGFVWDEGFHQIGIAPFDAGIARDVIAHWLGLMEDDGYIAREQILGEAARRRVPDEFVVQHVEHANPPTLVLAIEKMLQQSPRELDAFLRLVFPFLERWYDWLLRTQRGPVNEPDVATLKWRGRKADDGKLVANTLASGLDDYPRASQPSENEMHVDLLAWMIKMSDVLETVAARLGLGAARTRAFATNKARFLRGLRAFHWNDELQSYFDVGDHSEDGRIEHRIVVRCRNDATGQTRDTTATPEQVRARTVACPAPFVTYLFPLGDGVGGVKVQQVFIPGTTKLQHVKHIGYVSVFPLLLKVLPPDAPELLALLAQVADPRHLWSPFGLRSMSTTDVFYERENAPGDNPYWRGAIWINANYLALDALHHYAQPRTGSPFRDDFAQVYQQLRTNVIATIFSEYERTGYLWEQYSGNAFTEATYGRGQRCHPFSGWTALVVNIMAEKY